MPQVEVPNGAAKEIEKKLKWTVAPERETTGPFHPAHPGGPESVADPAGEREASDKVTGRGAQFARGLNSSVELRLRPNAAGVSEGFESRI